MLNICFHKYELISSFRERCNNCENLAVVCFPEGIKVLECKKCGAIKLKDNYCNVSGYKFNYIKK